MSLQLLIHLSGIVNFTYGIYFQGILLDIPSTVSKTRNLYGGPWKYLTFINLWVQLLYFVVAFLSHLCGTTGSFAQRLRRFRDGLFATVAFPIGMFVGIIFWALYLVDRKLIFPEVLDAYIPPFENHVLHTTVIILQVLELGSSYHVYPSRKTGMAVTAAFCFAYLAWVNIIFFWGGIWVYPVFKYLHPVARALFMVACSILGGILYLTGGWLNERIWSQHTAAVAATARSRGGPAKGSKKRKD